MKKVALIAFTFLLFACKKDNVDTQAPTILVTSPNTGQVFTNGQTVTVVAAITDAETITKVQLHVQNKSTSADVLHFEDHPNTKNYSFSKSFTAQTGVTYKIEVEAVGNSGTEAKVETEVTGR